MDKDTVQLSSDYISRIHDMFNFDDAVLVYFYLINLNIHANDEHMYYMKVKQLVREEFDAAYQAGGYAKSFVEKICSEGPTWFVGAMGEESAYSIDEAGGPQQTLLHITFALMKINTDLAIKIRCNIAKIFYEEYELYAHTPSAGAISAFDKNAVYVRNRNARFERLKTLISDINKFFDC